MKLLEHHAEAIALAQVTMKVDVARKNLGDLHRHMIWQSHRIGGGKQRAADLAGFGDDVTSELGGFLRH